MGLIRRIKKSIKVFFEDEPNKLTVRCKRCNRIIKNPKYQKLGMGKTCYEKYSNTLKHKKLF